ncbi:hypothetical protein C8J57DRAFT_1478145, partial [Mycena rebaudengoi]
MYKAAPIRAVGAKRAVCGGRASTMASRRPKQTHLEPCVLRPPRAPPDMRAEGTKKGGKTTTTNKYTKKSQSEGDAPSSTSIITTSVITTSIITTIITKSSSAGVLNERGMILGGLLAADRRGSKDRIRPARREQSHPKRHETQLTHSSKQRRGQLLRTGAVLEHAARKVPLGQRAVEVGHRRRIPCALRAALLCGLLLEQQVQERGDAIAEVLCAFGCGGGNGGTALGRGVGRGGNGKLVPALCATGEGGAWVVNRKPPVDVEELSGAVLGGSGMLCWRRRGGRLGTGAWGRGRGARPGAAGVCCVVADGEGAAADGRLAAGEHGGHVGQHRVGAGGERGRAEYVTLYTVVKSADIIAALREVFQHEKLRVDKTDLLTSTSS